MLLLKLPNIKIIKIAKNIAKKNAAIQNIYPRVSTLVQEHETIIDIKNIPI